MTNKQGVEVFSMGDKNTPVNIAKAAVEHATKNDFNVLIIDTAGRLHVDEDMMAELIQIKENVAVSQTILVVDAMTGQDAVNVAKTFDEKQQEENLLLLRLFYLLPYKGTTDFYSQFTERMEYWNEQIR